jgi:hypothetical protein
LLLAAVWVETGRSALAFERVRSFWVETQLSDAVAKTIPRYAIAERGKHRVGTVGGAVLVNIIATRLC